MNKQTSAKVERRQEKQRAAMGFNQAVFNRTTICNCY